MRSELRLLLDLSQALACAAMTKTLKPLRKPVDALVVPFKQAEVMATELRLGVPHDTLDLLVLAWHHDHLSYPSSSKPPRSHQPERDFWLACADGLLGSEFATLKALVFDKLDTMVRASSLVEMVNSLIRPYLNSCKGQIPQETVNLIRFYHNPRRYQSGKRQGKAALDLLPGKPLEAPWWERLPRQVTPEQGVTGPGTVLSRPSLQLVTHNEWATDQQAIASDQAILEPTGASENDCRQNDSNAA